VKGKRRENETRVALAPNEEQEKQPTSNLRRDAAQGSKKKEVYYRCEGESRREEGTIWTTGRGGGKGGASEQSLVARGHWEGEKRGFRRITIPVLMMKRGRSRRHRLGETKRAKKKVAEVLNQGGRGCAQKKGGRTVPAESADDTKKLDAFSRGGGGREQRTARSSEERGGGVSRAGRHKGNRAKGSRKCIEAKACRWEDLRRFGPETGGTPSKRQKGGRRGETVDTAGWGADEMGSRTSP